MGLLGRGQGLRRVFRVGLLRTEIVLAVKVRYECRRSQLTFVASQSSHYLQTVSLPGIHFIPLSLSTSLNKSVTTFTPDPCVPPIQIFWPDHPVLLSTFPRRPFLSLHHLPGTCRQDINHQKSTKIPSLSPSSRLLQSSCASAADSFHDFWRSVNVCNVCM